MRRAAAVILGAAMITGCGLVTDSESEVILGSGVVLSEAREIGSFNRIEFGSEGRVVVTPGTAPSLTITADDNLQQYLEASIRGTTLWIRTTDDTDIDPSDTIVFRIGVEDLQSVAVTGFGNVEISPFARASFTIDLSGAGGFDLEDLTTDRLVVNGSGAGDVTVRGSAATAELNISGAVNIHGRDLEITEGSVALSGVGRVTILVTEQLTAAVSGAGSVRYLGDPSVESDITGVGSVERIEE